MTKLSTNLNCSHFEDVSNSRRLLVLHLTVWNWASNLCFDIVPVRLEWGTGLFLLEEVFVFLTRRLAGQGHIGSCWSSNGDIPMIPSSTLPAIKGRLPEHWLPKHIDANDPAFVVADMMEYLPRDRCFWFILLSQFSSETGRMWPQSMLIRLVVRWKLPSDSLLALQHWCMDDMLESKNGNNDWFLKKSRHICLPTRIAECGHTQELKVSIMNKFIGMPYHFLLCQSGSTCLVIGARWKDPCLSLFRYFRSTGILPLWSPILLFLMACGAFSKVCRAVWGLGYHQGHNYCQQSWIIAFNVWP